MDADDQPSNQEGEISKQGGDNTGQDMRSSTAPRETKGEGPEREKEGKEGEDGRGMKRKREGEEEGTGQGTEKKKVRQGLSQTHCSKSVHITIIQLRLFVLYNPHVSHVLHGHGLGGILCRYTNYVG